MTQTTGPNPVVTGQISTGIYTGSGAVGVSNGNVNVPSGGSVQVKGSLVQTLPGSGSGFSTIYTVGDGIGSTVINQTRYEDIQYLIVQIDGYCLELSEQNPISPRETMNICKFLTSVQMHLSAGGGLKIDWARLIEALHIDRHFTLGELHTDECYSPSNDEKILYIKLFSE